MESLIQDYRSVDGIISVAHSGKSWVSLFRFGEGPESHSRTRMEEVWEIEEVDFNIKGLSMDCFLPPSDLKKEQDDKIRKGEEAQAFIENNPKLPYKIRSASFKISASKVAAISEDDSYSSETDDDDF